MLLHTIHEVAQQGSTHQKSLHQKQLQVQTNPNRFHLVGILLSMLLKQHASDVAKAFSALIMVSLCDCCCSLCMTSLQCFLCQRNTCPERERERVSETLSMFKRLSTETTYVVCRCQSRNGSCCSAFFPKAHIIWANSKTFATTSHQEGQCSKNDRSECKSGLQA